MATAFPARAVQRLPVIGLSNERVISEVSAGGSAAQLCRNLDRLSLSTWLSRVRKIFGAELGEYTGQSRILLQSREFFSYPWGPVRAHLVKFPRRNGSMVVYESLFERGSFNGQIYIDCFVEAESFFVFFPPSIRPRIKTRIVLCLAVDDQVTASSDIELSDFSDEAAFEQECQRVLNMYSGYHGDYLNRPDFPFKYRPGHADCYHGWLSCASYFPNFRFLDASSPPWIENFITAPDIIASEPIFFKRSDRGRIDLVDFIAVVRTRQRPVHRTRLGSVDWYGRLGPTVRISSLRNEPDEWYSCVQIDIEGIFLTTASAILGYFAGDFRRVMPGQSIEIFAGNNHKTIVGVIISVSWSNDIACFRVPLIGKSPPPLSCRLTDVDPFEEISVIGMGEKGPVWSRGVAVGIERCEGRRVLIANAASHPHCVGGAIVDGRGQLAGIVQSEHVERFDHHQSPKPEKLFGVLYAIPISDALRLLNLVEAR